MFENTPYPGIRELLEALRAEGYTLYVATSKPEEMSVTILEKFDLAKYFRRICGASIDSSRSTKDAVIAYLLESSGAKEDMVMVGDTKYDILGAKAHGIPRHRRWLGVRESGRNGRGRGCGDCGDDG